jgi:hypothetical protein
MNAKDTVVGTAKKLVAEIVGDGKLAQEGARQAGGSPSIAAPVAATDSSPQHRPNPSGGLSLQASLTDEERFAMLLGHAALNVWSDLPRDARERLFTAAVDDSIMANALAIVLHDRHPRTAHPPKPTRIA